MITNFFSKKILIAVFLLTVGVTSAYTVSETTIIPSTSTATSTKTPVTSTDVTTTVPETFTSRRVSVSLNIATFSSVPVAPSLSSAVSPPTFTSGSVSVSSNMATTSTTTTSSSDTFKAFTVVSIQPTTFTVLGTSSGLVSEPVLTTTSVSPTTFTVTGMSSGLVSEQVVSTTSITPTTFMITGTSITLEGSPEPEDTLVINSQKNRYEPGETMVFTVTAVPNEELVISLEDPQGTEVLFDTISVSPSGSVTIQFETTIFSIEGTYTLFASQQNDFDFLSVGLGVLPEIQLVVKMDKLNYDSNSNARILIGGPSSSTISLLIIDPSDKPKFSDTITVGPDGKVVYDLNLSGFPSGVYTTVVSRGNSQAEELFSVGLQTGSGPIDIRTTKTSYIPGESILVLGNSDSNILVTLQMIDSSGNIVQTKETFTDKDGTLSDSSFRIPLDARSGTWSIKAQSGANFDTTEFSVTSNSGQFIVIVTNVEKSFLGTLVLIKGFGAAPSQTVVIEVISSNCVVIDELRFSSTGVGDFSTIWKVPEDTPPGTYTIKATSLNDIAETTFNLENGGSPDNPNDSLLRHHLHLCRYQDHLEMCHNRLEYRLRPSH